MSRQIVNIKGFVYKLYFQGDNDSDDFYTFPDNEKDRQERIEKLRAAEPLACVVIAQTIEEALGICKETYPHKIVESVHSDSGYGQKRYQDQILVPVERKL